ncbi:MAG: PPOX class F420-dependent oxidoreductase [Armatimonadetes bacterium]|nr:PPOX class F420-dependent oxidoreductase [Armatimonadota bacterium]
MPDPFASLVHEKFVCLTTYRRNGAAVPTPMWFVPGDGVLYMRTDERSGKAKRIRLNGRAAVAPSDFRGRPTGRHIECEARLVPAAEMPFVDEGIKKKYGFMKKLVDLRSRLTGVRITCIEIRPA